MSWMKYSRASLVVCAAGGLALSGCAGGAWGRLVGKKQEEPPTRVSLAWAKLKEEEGRLTDARASYEKVLVREPNNVDAVMGMARLNVKAQRMVDAEQGYSLAMKLQPKSTLVLSEVGQFYAQQQRWDRAIPLLQEAQRIEPHEKSHQYKLAVALTKAGRTSDALPHFTEAVGEAAAHYNVGRMLVESGKTKEAEEQFTLALAKDPSLTDANYFLNEIRAGRNGISKPATIATATNPGTPTMQQVSGTTSGTRPTVSPADNAQPSGRPPLYPHVGYEELPPPPDGVNEASLDQPAGLQAASAVTQTSGFSNPTPEVTSNSTATSPRNLPRLRLQPTPGANNGAHVRVSTTQQLPLGR